MDRARGPDWLSFVKRPLADAFARRMVSIAPGGLLPYDATQWRDAIVVVDAGEVVLEGLSGRRYTFRRGDVLWLTDLPLRALHNHGNQPVVLVAIARTALRATRSDADTP